jgi:centromeric protein E
MGAIAGEELKKMEKTQVHVAREEKILVLVRLRPLNEKEILANEAADWECINDTTVLYRNTLREGSTFPSAYSFGKNRNNGVLSSNFFYVLKSTSIIGFFELFYPLL